MEPPFNMLIVGKTECGKTHYLLDTIEKDYPGIFSYIFLICPTYEWNKTYQEWKYKDDPKFIYVNCDHEKVEDFLKYISAVFAGTKSLIIIDDCASGQTVKNRVSELVRLAFSARHYSLSVVLITQKLTAVSPSYRENISKIVMFKTMSTKVWDTIMDEYLEYMGVTKEKLKEIINEIKTNKYARLEISLRDPESYEVVRPDF